MKLHEVLMSWTWQEVSHRLSELYPDQALDGYRRVFSELRTLSMSGDASVKIVVEMVTEDGYTYADVYGDAGGERLALGFCPWADWVSWELVHGDIPQLSALVHVLYDMTFFGYSEAEIMEIGRIIESDMDDFLSGDQPC